MFGPAKISTRSLILIGVITVAGGARAAPYSLQLPPFSDLFKRVALPSRGERQSPEQPPSSSAAALEASGLSDTSDPNLRVSYAKTWGTNSRFSAYVKASFANHADRDRRTTNATFSAGGYALGRRMPLIEAYSNINRGAGTSYSYFAVLGDKKWSSSSPTPVYNPRPWRRESPEVRQRIPVGPIPVSVGAVIGGAMHFSLAVATPVGQPHSIDASARPSVEAYGKVDVTVDYGVARAGVQGSLTIIEDRVPATLRVGYVPESRRVTSRLKVDNSLRSLNGKFSIYAKVKVPWFGWKKRSKTLFSWKGLSRDWNLIDRSVSTNI